MRTLFTDQLPASHASLIEPLEARRIIDGLIPALIDAQATPAARMRACTTTRVEYLDYFEVPEDRRIGLQIGANLLRLIRDDRARAPDVVLEPIVAAHADPMLRQAFLQQILRERTPPEVIALRLAAPFPFTAATVRGSVGRLLLGEGWTVTDRYSKLRETHASLLLPLGPGWPAAFELSLGFFAAAPPGCAPAIAPVSRDGKLQLHPVSGLEGNRVAWTVLRGDAEPDIADLTVNVAAWRQAVGDDAEIRLCEVAFSPASAASPSGTGAPPPPRLAMPSSPSTCGGIGTPKRLAALARAAGLPGKDTVFPLYENAELPETLVIAAHRDVAAALDGVIARLSLAHRCERIALSIDDYPAQRMARQILRLHAGMVDVPEPGLFISTRAKRPTASWLG